MGDKTLIIGTVELKGWHTADGTAWLNAYDVAKLLEKVVDEKMFVGLSQYQDLLTWAAGRG